MEVDFAHLCDVALIDQQGKLSVVGIFEGIVAPAYPVVQPSMCIAFQASVTGSEIGVPRKLRVELADPDGQMLLRIDGMTAIGQHPRPGERLTMAHALRFPPWRIAAPGPYGITIFIDDKPAKQLTMVAYPAQSAGGMPAPGGRP